MKKILGFLFVALSLVSCGGRREALLPNVSGKAGEVIVVMKKADWEGALGSVTRDLLACDCLHAEPLPREVLAQAPVGPRAHHVCDAPRA